MTNEELVRQSLENLGGRSNVISATNCMTRLRIEVKDDTKINEEAIKKIEGVLGVVHDRPGYIEIVDTTIKRIRREWARLKRNTATPMIRDALAEDEDAESIFGTYEILYESLEIAATGRGGLHQGRELQSYQDAMQLLQVFSYMHFQNIRLDMLVCAAVNPIQEQEDGA